MRERYYVKNALNTNNDIENHGEELRQKAKEHYEQYKGQKLEKQKEKIECPICKIDISRYKMSRHERTKRHRNNLNKTTNKQIKHPILSDRQGSNTKKYLNDIFPSFQTPD